MDTQTAYLGLLTAGAALGGVFFPVAHHRWPSLVSGYTKADLEKRGLAAFVDALTCAVLFGLLVAPLGIPIALVLSPFYLLVRDRILPGQSLGKLLVGLVVIELDSGSPSEILSSVRRNVFFVVPGFNLVAVMFEARAIQRDSQGMRLGDRFARTQVVEGKEAPELVKLLQSWLLELVEFGRETSRRRDLRSLSGGARAGRRFRSAPTFCGSKNARSIEYTALYPKGVESISPGQAQRRPGYKRPRNHTLKGFHKRFA